MKKKKLLTDRSGMLHDQYIEEAARKLAEDIDAEVYRGLLQTAGWQEVVLRPMTHETGAEIDMWVANKTRGKHWNRGLVWLFENDIDAMWFKMRWITC